MYFYLLLLLPVILLLYCKFNHSNINPLVKVEKCLFFCINDSENPFQAFEITPVGIVRTQPPTLPFPDYTV